MHRASLLLAVLWASALSGCIGSVPTEPTVDATPAVLVDASTGRPAADAAALEMSDGTPTLTGITTWFVGGYDHIVGNQDSSYQGQASWWFYVYRDGDARITIPVDPHGVVQEARRDVDSYDASSAGPHSRPLATWSLDSDEAAAALASSGPEWNEVPEDAHVDWLLYGNDGGCASWQGNTILHEEDGPTLHVVGTVDACTGEVTNVLRQSTDGRLCQWSQYQNDWTYSTEASVAQSAGLASPSAVWRWNNARDNATLHMQLEYGGGDGTISYSLTGPDGEIAQGAENTQQTFDGLTVGEYRLTFEGSGFGSQSVGFNLRYGGCWSAN